MFFADDSELCLFVQVRRKDSRFRALMAAQLNAAVGDPPTPDVEQQLEADKQPIPPVEPPQPSRSSADAII